VGCGLVVTLAAGALAVQRSREATAAAREAQVGRLVADSAALRGTDRELAALLAVEAHRLRPGPATRGALLGLFTDAPGFLGHVSTGPAPLVSARMGNDGRSIVAVGADGAVRLVDPDAGGVRRTLPAPQLPSQSAVVALAADREWAAVASWQGSDLRGGLAALNVVDLADGRPRMVEARLPLDPGSVAMSADGRYVAVAGGAEGRVLLVEPAVLEVPGLTAVASDGDVPGARWVAPLPSTRRSGDVRHGAAVAFDRRGRLLVGSPTGVVRVVDAATGAVVSTWTGAPPGTSERALVVSADGRVVVSAGTGGVVRWDPGTGRPLWTAPLDQGRCLTAVIAAASSGVICGGESGQVEGLDLATGRPTGARFDLQRGSVAELLLSGDGTTLFELSRTQPVLGRWRVDGTGPITRRLPVTGVPEGYSSDGRLLTVGGRSPVVSNGVNGRRPHSVVVDAGTGAVVDALDGFTSPVWTEQPSVLVAWQGLVGKVVHVGPHRVVGGIEGGVGGIPEVRGLQVRKDHLLVWDDDSGRYRMPTWRAWTLPGGRIARAGGREQFSTASLSADGREVFFSGESGLKAVDLGTGTRRAGPRDVVFAAASPSGVVVGATNSGQVGFYDPVSFAADGRSLRGLPGGIEQFAFSSDGRTMAMRGRDGALRLVDVESRAELGGPFPVVGRNQPVALRPDGQELAVPGPGGVLLWNLDAAAMVRAACTYAGRNLTAAETRAHVLEARQTCPTP
jgi:WD40 repeat protein